MNVDMPGPSSGNFGWTNPDMPSAPEPTNRPKHSPLLVVIGLGVLLITGWLVLTVVGGKGSGKLNPIAEAAGRTASYPGYRVAMTVSVSAPQVVGASFQMQGTGEFNGDNQSGRLSLSGSAPSGPSGLQVNEIITDGDLYLGSPSFAGQLPEGKSWIEIRDFLSLVGGDQSSASFQQSDPSNQLKMLAAVSDNFTLVDHEKVRGTQTAHYRASLDSAKEAALYRAQGNDTAADLVEKLAQQTGVSGSPVEVWVDSRGLVRRVRMSIPLPTATGTQATMEMSMDFFDFGAAAQVFAPPSSEVFDATDLAKKGLDQLSQ